MLSNNTSNNKKEFWWVPHEIEVWALAFQSSPELPNGCVNFTLYHKYVLYCILYMYMNFDKL